MPPKAADGKKGAADAPKKLTKAEQAVVELHSAVAGASKRFQQHEKQRATIEEFDKHVRDATLLDTMVERKRLEDERHRIQEVQQESARLEAQALAEWAKQNSWDRVSETSNLPSVHRENEINAFLSSWRDEEAAMEHHNPPTQILVPLKTTAIEPAAALGLLQQQEMGGTGQGRDSASRAALTIIRGEMHVDAATQRRKVDEELSTCLDAKRLGDSILCARDEAAVTSQNNLVEFHSSNLGSVYLQIRNSLDAITRVALRFYDGIIENQNAEMLIKSIPDVLSGAVQTRLSSSSGEQQLTSPTDTVAGNGTANSASKSAISESIARAASLAQKTCAIKYGLWVKIQDTTRRFPSFIFDPIEISIDPKDQNVHRLPQALGLSKENIAIRVMQLSFNPFLSETDTRLGEEYYVLDCVVYVDVLDFEHRPTKSGRWLLRGSSTSNVDTLNVVPYPPDTADVRAEDSNVRVSFEIPPHVVRRQPVVLVGKWAEKNHKWEPCCHGTFRAALQDRGTVRPPNPRRCTITTPELSVFGLLQEKGFDVPYEQWQIVPASDDEVLLIIECQRRGQQSDREVRILVRDGFCRLTAPDDAEVAYLRNNWFQPATLLRLLARAGLNFLLNDADAAYLDGVIPKQRDLEQKLYRELAGLSLSFSISSTRHNRYGEDPAMALFRVSKKHRSPYSVETLGVRVDVDDEWRPIRYHSESCVEASFTEASSEPDMSKASGVATHWNLNTLLTSVHGEDTMRNYAGSGNFMVRRCVEQLLTLTRPLSWG